MNAYRYGIINDNSDLYEHYTKDGIEKYNVHIQPLNYEDVEFISLLPSEENTPLLNSVAWFSNKESKIFKKLKMVINNKKKKK